jgi:hypothetical protein
MAEEVYAAEYCQALIDRIWTFADWRESLTALPPFYLVGDKADYGPPIYAVPQDFMGLRSATLRIVYDGDNVTSSTKPLTCKSRQSTGHMRYGEPEVLSFEPSVQSFRVFPILGIGTTPTQYIVEGVYKTLPKTNLLDTSVGVGIPILASQITRENYTKCLLPLDDRHYATMQRVLKAIVKAPANLSEEIGTSQYIDSLLYSVATQEGVEIGSGSIAPEEPLSIDPLINYYQY